MTPGGGQRDVAAAATIGSLVSPSVRVGTVMHRGLIACRADCSGLRVARIMAAHRIHSVVVTFQGAPPGLVTDREIVAALYEGTLATRTAAELARPAAIVTRDDTLRRATECMHEHETTHALVVDDHRSLHAVGVLSVLDVAEVLVEATEP